MTMPASTPQNTEPRKRRWKIHEPLPGGRWRKKIAKARMLYLSSYARGELTITDLCKRIPCGRPTFYAWVERYGWDRELAAQAASVRAQELEQVADDVLREMRERQLKAAKIVQLKMTAELASGNYSPSPAGSLASALKVAADLEHKVRGFGQDQRVTMEHHLVREDDLERERRLGKRLGRLLDEGKITEQDLLDVVQSLRPEPKLVGRGKVEDGNGDERGEEADGEA